MKVERTSDIGFIKNKFEKYFRVNLSERVKTHDRYRLRSVYYKVCKTLLEKPTVEKIGNSVKRDHSTVTYSLNRFDNEVVTDKSFQEMHDEFIRYYKKIKEKDVDESLKLVEEIKVNDLLTQKIEFLKIEVEDLKKKTPITRYEQIDNLLYLLNNFKTEEDRELFLVKLEALYNLNKSKIQ